MCTHVLQLCKLSCRFYVTEGRLVTLKYQIWLVTSLAGPGFELRCCPNDILLWQAMVMPMSLASSTTHPPATIWRGLFYHMAVTTYSINETGWTIPAFLFVYNRLMQTKLVPPVCVIIVTPSCIGAIVMYLIGTTGTCELRRWCGHIFLHDTIFSCQMNFYMH